MPTDDLMAWLGSAAEDLTPEQIARLADEARSIAERYPDPDEQMERDVALSAAMQYLLGEADTEDANRGLIDARRRQAEAYATSVQLAVMLVRDGTAKATAARRVGIDRMSLLKALGER